MSKISAQKLKKLVTLVLVVVGVFLVVNQFVLEPGREKARQAKEKEEAESRQEQKGSDVVAVKVIDVVRHDYIDVLEALGNIKGGMEVKLTFTIPGTIKAINYREGEMYKKGALLMSLDEEDILLRMKRVEAQKNKSQTTVDMARQKLEEHEKLYKIGAIPKSTLEKVKLEVESSEYDLEAARLEVEANEVVLDKSNMYAPSDGMLGELFVAEGETISQTTLIGSHILTEYVKPEFGVIERDMKKIKAGQSVDLMVDAYPDKVFKGIIDSISPVVGGASRTATVAVKVDNPDRLLLPGMFARIKVDLYKKKNAIVVPTEAIVKEAAGEGQPAAGAPTAGVAGAVAETAAAAANDAAETTAETVPAAAPAATESNTGEKGEATSVFVLNTEDSTVKKTAVKVGYTRTDYSEIAEGLQEGQTIVVTGLEGLKDGAKVEVIEKQTLEF